MSDPTISTPWGWSDSITQLSPGIDHVTTPRHGGIHISPAMLESVPVSWQYATFNRQGQSGWFEEDVDWCMIALIWPLAFSADQVQSAGETFMACILPKLVASTNGRITR